MERKLAVELGTRRYDILIGRCLAGRIREVAASLQSAGRKVAVITDQHVAGAQTAFLEEAFGRCPVHVVPAGETSKCFRELERCSDFLITNGLDRKGVLFAVGGGVVGDLAGFAAASFLRGIEFYQVPTTLLAMVDSSVGGKTGVNLKAGKNLVGAFHQPKGVFADLEVLTTLPEREFRAGMAEVIKHGLLADAELFHQLETLPELNAESSQLDAIIERNCAIKAAVVKSDETEQAATGGRALLNLGHTFGHAIEAVAGYGRFLHGEAIGTGLVLAAELSRELGLLTTEDVGRIRQLVVRYHLPAHLDPAIDRDALLSAMTRDKKAAAGSIKFVVLESIGNAVTRNNVDWHLVRKLVGFPD